MVTNNSEEISKRINIIVIGLKSVSKCFVSTKDPPQKSMATKR